MCDIDITVYTFRIHIVGIFHLKYKAVRIICDRKQWKMKLSYSPKLESYRDSDRVQN